MSDPSARRLHTLADDVRKGFAAKPYRLPPRIFYDEQGSRLFEEITGLPEYYLTRSEREIFERHGSQIVEQAGCDLSVLELGVGSATKTMLLLAPLARRQKHLLFCAADVSATALRAARSAIETALPPVEVLAIEGQYSDALGIFRGIEGPKLVLFIGSSIGNCDPDEAIDLLEQIRSALSPGDALLLGTDLVKDPALLVAAYDDSRGVTAAFNRNALAHINRELGGSFETERFRHVAVWNEAASRIEIYLESECEQRAWISAVEMDVRFLRGDRIHTENCHKFSDAMVDGLFAATGFRREATWTDSRGWFAEHLARVLPG